MTGFSNKTNYDVQLCSIVDKAVTQTHTCILCTNNAFTFSNSSVRGRANKDVVPDLPLLHCTETISNHVL